MQVVMRNSNLREKNYRNKRFWRRIAVANPPKKKLIKPTKFSHKESRKL